MNIFYKLQFLLSALDELQFFTQSSFRLSFVLREIKNEGIKAANQSGGRHHKEPMRTQSEKKIRLPRPRVKTRVTKSRLVSVLHLIG